MIGSALDRSGLRDVLGTVAGDDTVLVICSEGAEGTKVAVREDRGQWLFVERADGQQGWVKTEALGRVVPL